MVVRRGTHHFTVSGLWPRADELCSADPDGPRDLLLFLETAQRAGRVIAQRHYRLPPHHLLALRHIQIEDEHPELPPHVAGPVPVGLDVSVAAPAAASQSWRQLSMSTVLLAGGVRRGRVRLRWEAMSAQRYRALRRRERTARDRGGRAGEGAAQCSLTPLRPAEVGRRRSRDVLLAAPHGDVSNTWRLRLDAAGRDRTAVGGRDHIPERLLLDALRQAAHAAEDRKAHVGGLDVSFTGFAARDVPTVVEVVPGGRTLLVRQRERTVASAVFRSRAGRGN
ncbi:AfsA-related hotdog domain-containing protein [Streptomyces sp. NPDC059009]|uniref:AfsA-related hotdog domain-containing protein n=1 Tax=Streptomyces sp. NPDC059009 TaxID=3346694 RepID=UPI0036B5C7CB